VSVDVVIPTGTANLASVMAAFDRLNVRLVPGDRPDDVERADRVVVPGVGTFGAAMDTLAARDLVAVVRERIESGRPTLAICVGMQILASSSTESEGRIGLGVAAGTVSRFDDDLIVPQLAWSRVTPPAMSSLVEPGWAYFANSYRLERAPDGWTTSTARYGKPFVAAMEHRGVLACQFHPELSGSWGSGLLARWLDSTDRAS
jgi:imidazole glycerol phosphate synthase glutamine amidotransferase subunit